MKIQEISKRKSYQETFPLMPVYRSKESGQKDLSLSALLSEEKTLTFNPNSDTGFDQIEITLPTISKQYSYLKKPLEKNNDSVDKLCRKLLKQVEEYFKKTWDKDKFHLITHSSGMDSRIISYTLAILRDKMDLGKLHFRCHEPEGEIFKKLMKEQGWKPSQYSVYKDGRFKEKDYYPKDFKDFNGFSRPKIEFWDDIKKEDTVIVAGLTGGEIFSYPLYPNRAFSENRYKDFISNTRAIFPGFANLYSTWADVLLPFASYGYLDIAFRVDKKHFKMVKIGKQERDNIRLGMLKIFGNSLPFYIGHNYNLSISQKTADKMKSNYYGSKFYNDFKDHKEVREAQPWEPYLLNDIKKITQGIDTKLYGLAACYQTMFKNTENIYDVDYLNLDGNYVHKTAIVTDNVRMGKGNVVMPYAVLGHSGFIRGNKEINGIIEIGNGNKIGCHAVIMTGETGLTKIGNDNLLMNYVNIGHDCEIGNGNEIGAKSIVCGFTKIGNDNQIKVGTRIRNRLKIGNKNVIGMGSNVIKNVGNQEKIMGNPAI